MSLTPNKQDDATVECREQDSGSSRTPPEQPNEQLLPLDLRPEAEKQLLRTLDMRLLPAMILINFINLIDRSAIASARLKGLQQDLGLTDVQYETALAILYISYIPAQIPSNLILNRISRPSLYISACVICWGVTSTFTGATRNYVDILVTRVLVGLPEAAFHPGGTYLLSRWYTRKELSFRVAIVYAGGLISGAFGSVMAAGILSGMEGRLGVRAWRWLFFIEGAITIAIGILAVILLPDYPHNTRWLTPAQRRLAQLRLAEDTGEADEDSASDSVFKGLFMALKDPKVPLFALMACCQLVGVGFSTFFPTIVATLGFSTTTTLLLAAPPWIFAAVFGCFNALHADRTGERYLHMTGPFWLIVIGYAIAASTMSIPGRYFATFLLTSGSSGYAVTLVWLANTVPRPPAKRSAAIAIVSGFGNTGIMISAFIWKAKWAPGYRPSMCISIAALMLGACLATVIRCILKHQNKELEREDMCDLMRAERERIEEAALLEDVSYTDALERRRGFRYLL